MNSKPIPKSRLAIPDEMPVAKPRPTPKSRLAIPDEMPVARPRPTPMPRIIPDEPKLWENKDTCYYYIGDINPTKNKLAIFDLDDTIQQMGSSDFMYDEVLPLFEKLNSDGYLVAILSNQYGISKGIVSNEDIQSRCKDIPKYISIFYATCKDKYRKPCTGMYGLFLSFLGIDRSIVHPDSFYCGDAGGRKGDFAITDRYLAYNCDLKFKTPEEMFLGKKSKTAIKDVYNDLDVDDYVIEWDFDLPESDNPYLLLMVGPQGSGKSTIAKKIANKYNWVIINNDTLGKKAMDTFKTALHNNKSVIIDNTNPKPQDRDKYIDLASGYTVLAIYIDIPKLMSIHMCNVRVELTGCKHMPIMAQHIYYKSLVEPSEHEGISNIQTLEGIAFDKIPKEFYYRYNLSER